VVAAWQRGKPGNWSDRPDRSCCLVLLSVNTCRPNLGQSSFSLVT
jgi:hypothetical protein